jgi:hypothetical protein
MTTKITSVDDLTGLCVGMDGYLEPIEEDGCADAFSATEVYALFDYYDKLILDLESKTLTTNNSEVQLSSAYDDQKIYIPVYDTGHGDQECCSNSFNSLGDIKKFLEVNKDNFINLRIMVVEPNKPYTIFKG